MKLPLLLTQFLYKNKKLNLPGIGQFTMDPETVIPEEHSKDLQGYPLDIAFKASNTQQVDAELIDFIRVNTGKIRPLATADLESYINLGQEMLNIGKPFYLEGIGTLIKTQDGRLEFTSGEFASTKMEGSSAERSEKTHKKRQSPEDSMHEPRSESNAGRKIMIVAAIVAGLAIVGGGGYLFYKKNTSGSRDQKSVNGDVVVPPVDTTKTASLTIDSTLAKDKSLTAPVTGESTPYHFIILRTHNKERALKRYNQLLSYDLKINMETKDSSYFKVFFSFPAMSKDTTHIKDSLRREYAHDIFIER